MKKILSIASLLFLGLAANAQNWSMDKSHSGVSFTLAHMMISEVDGSFSDIDASFTSEADDISDAVFSFTAQAASIYTANERRDGHLKSGDFFDVENHATLTFKSTSFEKVDGESYKMTGDLTIKEITKSVTFDVVVKGPIEHPRSKKKLVGLVATAVIDRLDFGLGDEGSATLGREITVTAKGEFSKD